ncbi:unnamed protein product [Chondrus crispus]|uniref:Uncharacterized protein n=1 Tax=Chondrus crispus TaxID=2769 RepID=R7QJB0_CHOCR|nr:unnamed protein product [Chondrus crispus]CDF37541.1 unnamed protein product [Chondrus crispus]|eukprot:XP_005717412.1 unnamed protein product [Chondrus crispus]
MDQSATGSATDAAEATAKERQVEASKKRSSQNFPLSLSRRRNTSPFRLRTFLSLWRATILTSASIRAVARDPSGGTTMYQTSVCCGQVPCWRSVCKTRGGIVQTRVYFTSSEFVGKWQNLRTTFLNSYVGWGELGSSASPSAAFATAVQASTLNILKI